MYYSKKEHGTSYTTLLRRISGTGERMVVVQDSVGNVFGGFMTQGFALKEAFFGTGDTFVFKVAVG